ncbi:kinetochore protein NDC80 homolog [Bicyclus anynana]|uniref:Kinetochore protein NDC80 homolog n=1 Tax=Bicyclus anynana TaxID=110368 RepID=A0A6J1P8C3_BICAN|nr:kinetochore protein NDC80 homolog [Bicyclus anynana]
MLPSRYVSGHPSSIRKSRLENKPSQLPVRRQGSTDRVSTDRRPSTTSVRSSSAEPARSTFGGPRYSKDASTTKMSTNKRSRSQTGEYKYGAVASTPVRSSHYSRATTTPLRTPEDRSRRWENSLERALAFVTVKDQRPISSAAWQRAEYARVCEALGARRAGGAALVRPLTIARFVDIVGELLGAVTGDSRLSTDNYVTKLPHQAKKLLYPSPVSKSWLKTVNTLHAFPQALALIAYLLDLATHCQMPVSDEWLFIAKDQVSQLKREYLNKCWLRFQEPGGAQLDDVDQEYLANLKAVLGDDEGLIQQLEQEIKEYELRLQDEEELAARADEARRVERRDALAADVRTVRAERRRAQTDVLALRAVRHDRADALRQLDTEIERSSAENDALRVQLQQQTLSVEERTRLLDEVDYATRVHDSKRALADQIAKMLLGKETELAQWQKRTLDSCVQYKQSLITLGAQLPALASLAIDEKELMGAECAAYMATAVETLREEGARLSARKAELMRTRSALCRRRAAAMEETRSKIADVKANIQREQHSLQQELTQEAADAAAWSREQLDIAAQLERLRAQQLQYARVHAELQHWQAEDAAWRAKLGKLREYVEQQQQVAQQKVQAARARTGAALRDVLAQWNERLERASDN